MNAAMALDVLLILLLAAGGAGGWIILQRLNRLKAAQEELRAALANFDVASARTDVALKRLEAGSLSKGAQLSSAARRAEELIAELSIMNAAGARIADRIESAIGEVRAIGGAARKRAA